MWPVLVLLAYVLRRIKSKLTATDDEETDGEKYLLWEDWIEKYKKVYAAEEKMERKTAFNSNLARIKDHNRMFEDKYSYRLQLNRFSDLTDKELSWMNGLDSTTASKQEVLGFDYEQKYWVFRRPELLPEAVDWRNEGCVTPIKSQGKLPSCWIFSAIGAIESHHKIANGILAHFPEKQLVEGLAKGRGRGDIGWAFEYIRMKGLHSGWSDEDEMGPEQKIALKGWGSISYGNELELEAVVGSYGPVAASLLVSDKFKYLHHVGYDDIFYDSGTYEEESESSLEHAVLVVGYGKDLTKQEGKNKYWIVKDSWGVENENDPNSGYRKIAKDRGNNCNIAGRAFYPLGVCSVVERDELPELEEPFRAPAAQQQFHYLTWQQWAEKHNKNYVGEELRIRKNIWERNLRKIKDHNLKYSRGEYTYRIDLTEFSDQKPEELLWMGGVDFTSDEEDEEAGTQGALGDDDEDAEYVGANVFFEAANPGPPGARARDRDQNVDWRSRGCVTRIKDQRPMQACWIFSAVAAVESRLCIQTSHLIELSEQQLVDCHPDGGAEGTLAKAFNYIRDNGITSGDQYPYVGGRQLCQMKENCAEIGRLRSIPAGDEKELEDEVERDGPVSVCLKVSDKFRFVHHTNFDDIFYDPNWREVGARSQNPNHLRHAVLVVGFGRDPKKPEGEDKYWIVKNSWGTGNETDRNAGYKKIAKERRNNCNVAGVAMYPVGARLPPQDN